MSAEREPIGVIGVGWVGLVTAACFAELGHPVIARDILPEKVEALSRGAQLPIHEPGLDELVRKNADRLTFTTEMSEVLETARLLFVCVDTPPTASGDADLSRVRAVVEELDADGDHVLIMKSTVPAGTGDAIRRDLPDLAYVSCPEFLKEGTRDRATSCTPTGSSSAPIPATRRRATWSPASTSRSAASSSAPTSPAPR